MASITISELRPAGSELFQDSESFLDELTDREMLGIAGGGKIKFSGIYVKDSFVVASIVGNTKGNVVSIVGNG